MTAEPLPAGPAPAGPWPAGPLPAGPGPAEPEPAEPAWLTEVRLRAGRRALWLRFLWAAHRYPGEDAMAISHSEVDRAIESALRPGELARAERRFYREDPAAAVVSETLGRLLAAGPDARWDHLTRALGLSVPDASLLALALAAEAAPEMRRVYGYLSDDTGPVDASPALARALWAWAPGLRVDAGSALLRWRLAWPRDASPDWFAADSRWVADPLLLAELTGDDPGARCGPAGRDVELTAEAVLYPAALEEIVGFAGSLSAVSWPAGTGQRRADGGVEVELAGPPGAGKTVLAAQACQKLGRRLVSVDAARLASHPDAVAVAVREARQSRLHGTVLTWQHAAGCRTRPPRRWTGSRTSRFSRLGTPSPCPRGRAGCGCGTRCRRLTATLATACGPCCRAIPPRRRWLSGRCFLARSRRRRACGRRVRARSGRCCAGRSWRRPLTC